jgi:hypothetical protein
MDKNLNLIASELFAKIRTQFPKISMKDEAGEPTAEEELSRSFSFDFVRNNQELGSVDIDLSDDDGLVVIFSNDLIDNQRDGVKKQWFNFLKELREFAKKKFLQFEIRDIAKSNLDKRDYEYLASKKQGDTTMSESKLWGGNKTSYQDLGDTRLIIRHSQPVNLNIPTGRTMHIENIYIENSQGERFLYPHKHLNGARALAQHIAHAGTPYDDIGQHVIGLSEELGSLRKFKNYVVRTPVVAEAMNNINEKVLERIDQIKQEIHSLQKRSYYETFAESFTRTESQEIPEEIVNDWIERLTIKTFNEELKNVFPYIYNLVDEDSLPVKEVDLQDLLSQNEEIDFQFKSPKISVEDQFEQAINSIIGESEDIFSKDQETQTAAIEKLNELVSQEFPVGTDGTNAIESLKGIIEDNELEDIFKELADVNPDLDARNILKDYIKIKDEENGTDLMSQINFGEAPAEPAAEAPAEPAAEEPPAPAPAPAPAAVPAATPEIPMPTGAPMAENLKRVVERAKRAGMTAEDTFTIFGEKITLADAIQRAGFDLNEFFDQGYKDSGDEVVEFVRSMFDEDGNTPKGPTGVLLSVEKKFGEEALDKAKDIMNELMAQAEMKRIQELSGISSPQEEGFGDELAYKAGNVVGKVQKGVRDTVGNIRQGVSDLASNFKSGQQAGQSGGPSDVSTAPPGQGAQPASPRPNPRTMTPGVTGPGGQGAQPYSVSGQGTTAPSSIGPKPRFPGPAPRKSDQPNVKGQAAREDLDAMLRIAGLR